MGFTRSSTQPTIAYYFVTTMNKNLTTFITGIILAFLLTFTVPLVGSQNTPLPQPTSSPSQDVTAPVVIENETLFFIQTLQGGLSVQERAGRINQRLRDFAENQDISLNQLEVYNGDKDGIPLTTITAGNILLMGISNGDAQKAGKPRSELAQEYSEKINNAVSLYRQERSLKYLLRATFWCVVATVLLIFVFLITNNVFTRIYQKLKIWQESYIHPVRIGNWELIRANQLDNIITWFVQFTQGVIILVALITYFPFVLRQFPWTRGLAETIEGHLIRVLQAGWEAFLGYLPNLLTIILVVMITYFFVRLSQPFFRELGEGTFSL